MKATLRRLWGWWRRLENKRELEDALNTMSDHMLKDIGLRREDILTVVNGGLPQRAPKAQPIPGRSVTRRLDLCPLCGRRGQAV